MTLYEELTGLVNEQAEDERLWIETHTETEANLQSALRRLHDAVGFIDEKVSAIQK